MKKHILFSAFIILLSLGRITAQTYLPVATVGYSLDGVAENTTAIGTTGGPLDASDFVLYSQYYGTLFSSSAVGLPNNGLIASGTRTYQLQNYVGPNVMSILPNLKDSLTFVTPQAFPSISLLSFGTQGVATVSITVRFTDNTTQIFNPVTLDDWFTIVSPVYAGFDRALRTTGNPALVGSLGNPRMFGADLAIACANRGKPIKRVIIQNNSSAYATVMAVSGAVPAYSVTGIPFVCSGSTATLNGVGLTTYTWLPTGTFLGSNSGTINVSPATTTNYTLTGTDGLGCPGYTTVTINVSGAVPVVSLAGSTQSVCLGAAATITASGALTYTITSPAINGVSFIPAATAVYTVAGANGCGTTAVTTTITVSPLTISASAIIPTICAGSQASLNASGATTYSWLPGNGSQANFSPFVNATTVFTVTGKTGNCSGTNTITITSKPLPTISITTSTTQTCVGDPVNLNVSGNAVTYTWSPGGQIGSAITVTPAQSLTYYVTGTNSVNCTSTVQQNINVNPSPTLNLSTSNIVVCVGGTSDLIASGATNYAWSTGASTSSITVNPSATTLYSVTGSYATGCNTTNTLVVAVFSPIASVSGNTTICRGQQIAITASGLDTYLWVHNNLPFAATNVNPTVTTIYTITGTATDPQSFIVCSASNTVQVSVNPNPTVTITSNITNSTICSGQSMVLTAAGAGSGGTYSWTTGAAPTASAVTTVSPTSDRTYSVTGTDINGCKNTTKYLVKVLLCTGIPTNAVAVSLITIYPNPSSGSFNVKADDALNLTIANDLGQQVRTIKLNASNEYHVTVEGLSAGIYFVTYVDQGTTMSQKIVITH